MACLPSDPRQVARHDQPLVPRCPAPELQEEVQVPFFLPLNPLEGGNLRVVKRNLLVECLSVVAPPLRLGEVLLLEYHAPCPDRVD